VHALNNGTRKIRFFMKKVSGHVKLERSFIEVNPKCIRRRSDHNEVGSARSSHNQRRRRE
jgi:hypothetical protein